LAVTGEILLSGLKAFDSDFTDHLVPPHIGRFHFVWKFLGLPFRDVELLPPERSSAAVASKL
jgi:hypothetical protein